ncbi:hypothetical protein DM01DRAFT_1339339 [Hesseltinella vesiculosa]|uniref:Uncharacterized protein n=1 Tax=Hesseltinella vesiculosa TaxID=101127 RepID=A0A1X2G7H5_9FUNG|nr:hypothetical protein DM01DRAFT_1339339 [Hesseltinella vesiculosa]
MALIKIISKFSKNGSSSIVTSSKNDSNNLTRPNNTSKKQVKESLEARYHYFSIGRM